MSDANAGLRSLLILFFFYSGGAQAGTLRVTPIIVEVVAPAQASTVILRNESEPLLHAQIRIMRWTQIDGVEKLEPTSDAVASPPIVALTRDKDFTVRIVRVATTPVVGEESYRVLVDEIPNLTARRGNTVSFVLRYSIPVFFTTASGRDSNIRWSTRWNGGKLLLAAANSGGRRLRLANLKITNPANGKIVVQRDGLLGYVLPGSAMRWPLTVSGIEPRALSTIKLVADSETRPVHATIAIQARR